MNESSLDVSVPLVSVVMPVRNEKKYIENSIKSILSNDYPSERIEVIVADGLSDDGTRDIVSRLSQEDARVKMVDNHGLTRPFALNVGIKASCGDVIIPFDGHAEMYPDYIKNAVDCLQKQKDAWIVGGCIETISEGYIGHVIAAAMASPAGVGNSRFRLGNYEGWVDTLPYGAHPKWIFEKVGYFDEELTRNQDDEFNLRINLAGGKIWMSPSIRAKFYSRSSISKLLKQYFLYGFWRIRTMQKHKRPATLRQVVPLIFVLSILILALAGFVWTPLWYLLGAEIGLYLLGIIAGAVDVGRKSGWKYMPLAPIIFSILHFAYGLGSIWGIIRFVLLGGKGMVKAEEMAMSR